MAKRSTRAASISASAQAGTRQVRCAVYTRKSTEEGLEQEFNSLDAQGEACAAYILSQRHEGWRQVAERYDDGGYSGGNMERPGLRRLLADVEAGKVDVIVVYKVDRLTRALADFAKIVDVLDAKGASFVSVTQSFNTTTSMGRLTLNVLLSFAQFEREVTGERIRDKIAASKKKGMWMGGPVPLGYDVVDRKLVVNEAEANTVRLIYARHQELVSLKALASELMILGVRSKRRTMRDGRVVGGEPYRPGALSYLLRNVIYTGRVRHHDHVYPGEHTAIIDAELWEASQAMLDTNVSRPFSGHRSLLNGMIQDAFGRPMTAAHAIRKDRRYRYYVSREREGQVEIAWRLPAGDLEAMVAEGVQRLLRDPLRLAGELGSAAVSPRLEASCGALADKLTDVTMLQAALVQLNASVSIDHEYINIELGAAALLGLVGADADHLSLDQRVVLTIPTLMKRRGHELRLVHAVPDDNPARRDERLIKLIATGYAAYEQLKAGVGSDNATQRSTLTRLARLRYLAPDIVTAIVEGRQPVELTSRMLLRISDLPLAWQDQRQVLGFG